MQPIKKILTVDDESLNNEIVQEILSYDYDVKTATTGDEALKIALDFQPDLILLDIMMPGMNGYEVCRRLRANSAFRDTIIIMVSAKETIEYKVKGYEVGASDYISKPFTEENLRESVSFFLRKCVITDSSS
ncbi:MAG: response regulator [Planctomycetota bacterium]|jgi:putative two-component system response regulator